MSKKRSIEKYKTRVRKISVEKDCDHFEHKNNAKKRSVEKYNTDLEHKNAVKRRSVEKYNTDLEHKNAVKLKANVCKLEKKCKRKFISNAIKEFSSSSLRYLYSPMVS